MPNAIPSQTIARIHELCHDGMSEPDIAHALSVSEITVYRYLRGIKQHRQVLWRRHETHNPLYDPWRDGVVALTITQTLMGDPQPGRRELVANAHRHPGIP